MDLLQVAFAISSLAVSTTAGFLGLFTSYRDRETGKITRYGRLAAFGIGIGAAISVASNLLQSERVSQQRIDTENEAQKQAKIVQGQIDRLNRANATLANIQSDSQKLKDGLSESLRAQQQVVDRAREELSATERVNNNVRYFADRLDPARIKATLHIFCTDNLGLAPEYYPTFPKDEISEIRISAIADGAIARLPTDQIALEIDKAVQQGDKNAFVAKILKDQTLLLLGAHQNDVDKFYSQEISDSLTRFNSSSFSITGDNSIIRFSDFVSQNQPHRLDRLSGWPGALIVIDFKMTPLNGDENFLLESNLFPKKSKPSIGDYFYALDEKTNGTHCITTVTLDVNGRVLNGPRGLLALRKANAKEPQNYLFSRMVVLVPDTFYVDTQATARPIISDK